MSKSKKSRTGSNSGSGKSSYSSGNTKSSKSGVGDSKKLSKLEAYIQEKRKDGGQRVTVLTHSDSNGDHPHIVVKGIPEKNVNFSFGLTDDPYKSDGSNAGKNRPLSYSPFPDERLSYIHRQPTVDYSYKYYNRRSGVVSKQDFEYIESKSSLEKIDNAVQSFLDKEQRRKDKKNK